MIPKKIHYCWLSEDQFPTLISNCISSWKKYLPDYEFVLWDTNKFNLDNSNWVKQAFNTKKYAFAADYIRLYAVYKFGGIYLDSDVEVLKSFNDLLNLPYFVGSEGRGEIEAGVFGAEKNCEWLGDCLKYYENRNFIKNDGSLDTLTLPLVMMSEISKTRNITETNKKEIFDLHENILKRDLYMLPQDFFCAKNMGTGEIEKTDNTYCIHHFAMSWVSPNKTLLPNIKRRLIKVFGSNAINKLIRLFGLRHFKDIFKV
jgi:hypothetical protein